jgi:hypothetical protein
MGLWRLHPEYPRVRLATIAALINGLGKGYVATIEKGYCNTDRKQHYAGHHWRVPGKGRTGNRLIVSLGPVVVFDHNSAETYRRNDEVLEWVEKTFGRIWERA